MALQLKPGLIVLALLALSWRPFCFGQLPAQAPSSAQMLGTISGTVVDQSGAVIVGARVKLSGEAHSQNQEALTGDGGQFSFANVAPGLFHLTVSSSRFTTQTYSGTLHSGETSVVPQIALAVAADVEVQVGVSTEEVAEEQIKIQEQQRVLGFIPNFYVSYIPNAAPLNPRQKFKLAFRTSIDPITFLFVAAGAGVEQAQNHFRGYGQGAAGYGRRFGAGYGDTIIGTFIGGAILPSLLKQDPRYFYKGTGTTRSRALYAIANSVICKGDNGRWQPNYSNILGNLAAGGISNAYYPEDDRNGAALTFENAAIGVGATAVANLFQEFVVRKFSRKVPNSPPAAQP